MADEERGATSSRKRVAGTQINKDNPEPDEDSVDPEIGTFQRATEEVMATRRIVKVKRHQTPSVSSSSSAHSNPFASINFVIPSNATMNNSVSQTEPTATDPVKDNFGKRESDDADEKDGDDTEKSKDVKDEGGIKADGAVATAGVAETGEIEEPSGGEDSVKYQTNETTGGDIKESTEANPEKLLEGEAPTESADNGHGSGETDQVCGITTGENSKTEEEGGDSNKTQTSGGVAPFSFRYLSGTQNAFQGLSGAGFSGFSASFGSGSNEGSTAAPPKPLFEFNSSSDFGVATNNGRSALPKFELPEDPSKASGLHLQEGPVETGEEYEKTVFTADAALYEYLDGGWKERGKGELKLNTAVSGPRKSRLIMRSKGNYRLVLNARLYPDMSLKNMDKKGVTFACANSAAVQSGLMTFALKLRDEALRDEFSTAVLAHKGEKEEGMLKTPDNAPNAGEV